MKSVFKSLLLGLMTTVLLANTAFAEWVYVTQNGKKYHHESSRFAKLEGSQKLSKEEAEELGYEPSKDYIRTTEKLAESQKK